jgi:hypothetical protein
MADMTKQRLHKRSNHESVERGDVDDEIETTLTTLADIDQVYVQYRTKLEMWSGPVVQKERLRAQLDALHQKDRRPHVLRLTELHERMVSASFAETVH